VTVAELIYGPDGPGEHDLRLVGNVAGKRVLDLGCGDGSAAVALAEAGAVVIAVDASEARLARGRRRAAEAEVRLDWHVGDLADLAFLRADSVDLVFSAFAIDAVEDAARVFRQVQRVLKPNAAFVFSHAHPFALCVEGGRVARSYLEAGPVTVTRWDEQITVYPRSLSETFTDLARAGFRIDALVEPAPPSPGTPTPSTVVWRARKEGS
jgi:ubiquinone/menaquinone biosynthesis C-methylase UbiE